MIAVWRMKSRKDFLVAANSKTDASARVNRAQRCDVQDSRPSDFVRVPKTWIHGTPGMVYLEE